MHTTAELTVDAAAIAHNTRLFSERTAGQLMAVLKADGFGHGSLAPLVLANGADWLGVTSIAEAMTLRAEAPAAPLLSWLNPLDADYEAAIRADVDLAVSSMRQLRFVAAAASRARRAARVHLHLDVGMNRDGAPRGEWAALCEMARLWQAQGSIDVVGIMGHLSSASDPTSPETDRERMIFDNGVRVARRRGLSPRIRHLAASAATLTRPDTHYELSRVGAGLYGIDPSRTVALRPALTLTAPVVSVRRVPRGSGVGYGHTYTTSSETTLALLPLGYGDGLPRTASGRAFVQLRGRRYPVVGLFSMDQIVVDVGDDGIQPGERATVFGPGTSGEPTVAEWADWAGTLEHDIVVGVGARVHRVDRRTIPAAAAASAALPQPTGLPEPIVPPEPSGPPTSPAAPALARSTDRPAGSDRPLPRRKQNCAAI